MLSPAVTPDYNQLPSHYRLLSQSEIRDKIAVFHEAKVNNAFGRKLFIGSSIARAVTFSFITLAAFLALSRCNRVLDTSSELLLKANRIAVLSAGSSLQLLAVVMTVMTITVVLLVPLLIVGSFALILATSMTSLWLVGQLFAALDEWIRKGYVQALTQHDQKLLTALEQIPTDESGIKNTLISTLSMTESEAEAKIEKFKDRTDELRWALAVYSVLKTDYPDLSSISSEAGLDPGRRIGRAVTKLLLAQTSAWIKVAPMNTPTATDLELGRPTTINAALTTSYADLEANFKESFNEPAETN